MTTSPGRRWDLECDLLVFGAGAAGMTAALVGAREGLETILCEKSEQVGGTTATSVGTIWIPGSRQSREAGLPDNVEAARTYLALLLGKSAADERLDMFLRIGPIVLDDLEKTTSVQLLPPPVHPDYKNLPGAATGGRALGALPFDGRKLGADFGRVRAPRREFMVLGGMMVGKNDIAPLLHPLRSWRNFLHASRLLTRQAFDRARFARGTRLVMGNALVARLFHDLRNSVDIRFATGLKELIRAGDDIIGAVVQSPAGELAIGARRGIVLATGGIGWSAELRDRLLPEAARRYSLAPPSNAGDGILAAERVGAVIDTELRSVALWMPSSVMEQPDGHLSVFPHIMLDRAKPGLLAVDRMGRRFVNEADSYHDFVEAMLASSNPPGAVPSFLVCDASFIRDYGLGLVRPGARHLAGYLNSGYLFEGDTVEALADTLGVDPGMLSQTIARYNTFAETGIDREFGRGASELNRFNGDQSNRPNPCLRRIGPGPYYAVAVWPADLASSAGLRADWRGRVLAREGGPLGRLYAAGNDAASIFRGTYPGPGTMIGPAIVFGWCAAMDAAGTLDGYLERSSTGATPD
jgi:succinate dehydrogenase/fumarate reductase flavoprotein subunit